MKGKKTIEGRRTRARKDNSRSLYKWTILRENKTTKKSSDKIVTEVEGR